MDACRRLSNWANVWQLRIALNKCFVQRISNAEHSFTNMESVYTLNDKKLVWSTESRDLGITVDSKLSFNKHIALVAHKSHVRSKLILKSFLSRNPKILTKAFITYVRPMLEYCTPVWSPHTQLNINKIESVQRRFTARIRGLRSISYPDRLKSLGLDSLLVRRLKYDLTTCHKIIRGEIDVSPDDFFTFATYSATRGHSQKLFKPQSRIDARKFSFANRLVDVWNDLPATVVEANTTSSFKAKLNNVQLDRYC
jgi:hypothetical protein